MTEAQAAEVVRTIAYMRVDLFIITVAMFILCIQGWRRK
jgi:hypothetical protein